MKSNLITHIKIRTLASAVVVALSVLKIASANAAEEEKATTEVAVHVGKITRTTLHAYVTGYGTVEPEPASKDRPPASARVATSITGLISDVNCYEGQKVEKGAVLFHLDSRAVDVQVAKAKQGVAFAEANFERQQKLVKLEGVSQRAYQETEQQLNVARSELANAETQKRLFQVEAPLTGTVVQVMARPGQAVDLTTSLAEIIDLERLVVSGNIPDAEAQLLKEGQTVEISTGRAGSSANSRPVVGGVLSFIASQVDPKTGTILVRASLQPNSGLRPGEFTTLNIVHEERKDCLAIPRDSVVTEGQNSSVWIVDGNKAVQKTVKTGLNEGGLVEVEGEGLKEGMTVVTKGAYGLPKETKIRVLAE